MFSVVVFLLQVNIVENVRNSFRIFIAFYEHNTKKIQNVPKWQKKLKNPFSRHIKKSNKQRNIFTFLHYHANDYSQEPNPKFQQYLHTRLYRQKKITRWDIFAQKKKTHKHTNHFQYIHVSPPSCTIDFLICAIIRLSERNTKQNKLLLYLYY